MNLTLVDSPSPLNDQGKRAFLKFNFHIYHYLPHLGMLLEYVLCGWLSTKATVPKELQPYRSFIDEITIIDGIAMTGRRITVPASWLNQLHLNHMDIEKMFVHTWINLLGQNEHWHRKNDYKLPQMPRFLGHTTFGPKSVTLYQRGHGNLFQLTSFQFKTNNILLL